jgi:orotate phosphoribosyltransferase
VSVAQRDLGPGVPVRAVLGLRDIIERLGGEIGEENLTGLKEYRMRHGAEE